MSRLIIWDTDLDTGARTIVEMVDVLDIRKAWKRIYSDARQLTGKCWHIGYTNGNTFKDLKNEEVLPIGNQMRIRYHTREVKKIERKIMLLLEYKRVHVTEIAELGGPELF